MVTEFESFVEELQQEILEQAWAVYSAKVVKELNDTGNLGRMPEPDIFGIVLGWCGDAIEIYLRL
jgi:hypothetical protein